MIPVTSHPPEPASPKNGRSDGHPNPEPFRGPGFGFVRYFLLTILLVFSLLLALIGVLACHAGMEVTITGIGVIEPMQRQQVKTPLGGLIDAIHVAQWQPIREGDALVTLNGREWQLKLQKLDTEMAINQSRQQEIETRIQQDRAVLYAEFERADAEVRTLALQLEQVQREYQLYDTYYRTPEARMETPVETLLPVRLRKTMLQRATADRNRARQQARAIQTREQEIETLKKQRERLEQERRFVREQLQKTTLRAPISGIVLTADLSQRIGDRLQPGETVLELAKLGGWQARVLVQEVDIPRVKLGHPVRLYINAFPHMEYRIFEGRVTEVSAQPAPESRQAGSPSYPVKIAIQNPTVTAGDKTYTLAYGMSAEAKIVVEKGPVLVLLKKKLLKTVGKVNRNGLYRLEHTPPDTLETPSQSPEPNA